MDVMEKNELLLPLNEPEENEGRWMFWWDETWCFGVFWIICVIAGCWLGENGII